MDSFHLKVHSVKKINNPELSNYYILCKCGYFATIFVNFPFELFQNFINILVFISKIAKKKKKIPHFNIFLCIYQMLTFTAMQTLTISIESEIAW